MLKRLISLSIRIQSVSMKKIPRISPPCSHQLSNPNLATNTSSIKWPRLMTAPKAFAQEVHLCHRALWVITGRLWKGCAIKPTPNSSYQQLSNRRKSVTYKICRKRMPNTKNSYSCCNSKLTRSNVTLMSSPKIVKKSTKNLATRFLGLLLSSILRLESMRPWTRSIWSIRAVRCKCWTWSTRLTVRSSKAKDWERQCVKIKLHFEKINFICNSHLWSAISKHSSTRNSSNLTLHL